MDALAHLSEHLPGDRRRRGRLRHANLRQPPSAARRPFFLVLPLPLAYLLVERSQPKAGLREDVALSSCSGMIGVRHGDEAGGEERVDVPSLEVRSVAGAEVVHDFRQETRHVAEGQHPLLGRRECGRRFG